jgi:hypothetical protein
MNLADLKKPFAPEKISWRVGPTTQDKKSGIALAYIDARDVMERLDEVCGDNWQCTYPHANGKTVCSIGIKVGDEWVWRSNGAGDTDMEAEKGALSDAFKRAAVCFGIGRYLYDVENVWVTIEPAGKSYKIAQHEYAKLRKLLEGEKHVDEDVQAGTRNWLDKQKDILIAYTEMGQLTAWLKKHASLGNREGNWDRPTPGSTLDKLLKFSAPLFNELKSYYMEKMREV